MICSNTQETIFLHCHNEQDTRDKQHIIILCVFLCVHANPFLPSLTFRQGLKTQQILVPGGSHPSTLNIEMPPGGRHDDHVTILQVPCPLSFRLKEHFSNLSTIGIASVYRHMSGTVAAVACMLSLSHVHLGYTLHTSNRSR